MFVYISVTCVGMYVYIHLSHTGYGRDLLLRLKPKEYVTMVQLLKGVNNNNTRALENIYLTLSNSMYIIVVIFIVCVDVGVIVSTYSIFLIFLMNSIFK